MQRRSASFLSSTGGIFSFLFSRLFIPFFLLFWILIFWYIRGSDSKNSFRGSNEQDGTTIVNIKPFSSLTSIFNVKEAKHLIIVPGHAVLRFDSVKTADTSDHSWYLLDYQRNQGFPQIISSHIQKALEILQSDDNSVLIFSGGQTRRDVGPYSEGISYYFLAHYKGWIKPKQQSILDQRIGIEEYARDSFENLLFSICRFKEMTGNYPLQITIVGFDFKEKRFRDIHRAAIAFPSPNFTYVGIHSTSRSKRFDQQRAQQGELIAIKEFEKDLYGCFEHELYEKRIKRNPFHRFAPYLLSCPEIKELLVWCGPGYFASHHLPWMT
jgi:hypothetical protein